MWGGRFSEKTNPQLRKLNASITFDKRMAQEDIQGSQAYAKALHHAGLISDQEEHIIQKGLNQVKEEWNESKFQLVDTDEDIHTANERRLKEIIGQPALKLHTGRSRNDQVTTDTRLWLKIRLCKLNQDLCTLIEHMVIRSEGECEIILPGYTHLQRAQPIRWSHWLLSHAWSLKADSDRLKQVYGRVNVMPLGSGAVAGNPFPIDRDLLAQELKFEHISPNSMYAVGDRDFIAEFLFWASLTAIHLSRLAEDLILYSSQEFGFVVLADTYSTGSSLMPQKRNPDSLELIRGRTGRIFGHCAGFMMVLKGLPSTYNKDLQEDKEAMFNVYDSMRAIIQIAGGVIKTLQVKKDACAMSLSPDMLATDIPYYLVKKGMSFRDAHHITGIVVLKAEKHGVKVSDLSLEELNSVSTLFESDMANIWSYERSVEQYQVVGGTSKVQISHQISALLAWLVEAKKFKC